MCLKKNLLRGEQEVGGGQEGGREGRKERERNTKRTSIRHGDYGGHKSVFSSQHLGFEGSVKTGGLPIKCLHQLNHFSGF